MSTWLRSLVFFAALATALAACGAQQSAGPETCESRCKRSCNERCSGELASCEASCDNIMPMDLGNTEKQSPMANVNQPCRRACTSQEQTCLRTCVPGCGC